MKAVEERTGVQFYGAVSGPTTDGGVKVGGVRCGDVRIEADDRRAREHRGPRPVREPERSRCLKDVAESAAPSVGDGDDEG